MAHAWPKPLPRNIRDARSAFLTTFGDVLVRMDMGDYQGDTFLLIERDGKLGWLVFGWGSCEGCDALYACETIEELQYLQQHVESQIVWFDTLDQLTEWLDSTVTWYTSHRTRKKILLQVLELFRAGQEHNIRIFISADSI